MTSLEKLQEKLSAGKFICVGLDPDINKIPKHLLNADDPIFEFNKTIIDHTREQAAAYKLNFAFYELCGSKGLEVLEQTVKYIGGSHLIIGDAKRADIGNTSEMYAKSLYEYYGFDAVTVNPYLGKDSILPFLNYREKTTFILTLTSNPGASDLEKLKLSDGSYLFQKVIEVVRALNSKNNCGIVFGATQFQELKENIDAIKNLPILLPGVGAQGGSYEEIINLFHLNEVKNFLINVSRGIIYKDSGKLFGTAAEKELERLNQISESIISKRNF